MQDQSDRQPPQRGRPHQVIPGQRGRETVQMRDVLGVVDHALQTLDPQPEQQRGKPRQAADHQRCLGFEQRTARYRHGDEAEYRCQRRQHNWRHPFFRRRHNGLLQRHRLPVGIDLVDQHDRIVDDDAGKRDQPQNGKERQRLPGHQQRQGRADQDQRNGQKGQQYPTGRIELEGQRQQHDRQCGRDARRELGVDFRAACRFAIDLEAVSVRQVEAVQVVRNERQQFDSTHLPALARYLDQPLLVFAPELRILQFRNKGGNTIKRNELTVGGNREV